MAAILQVVGTVGSTTSLLDLNDNPAGILAQSTGLALQQPGNSTGTDRMPLWSQPDAITEATARSVVIPVTLFASTIDGLGAKVASLAKLVSKTWVLRVRRSGATGDSWLRCYPSIPQMDSTITGGHAGATIAGQIVCDTEPYAYGARVDASTAAVGQNPSSSSAFLLDVAGVTGDAPTPAVIRCSDTTNLLGGAHATLVAVRRTGTPTSLSGLYTSADSGVGSTVGSGVTVTDPFSDATFAGGAGIRMAFSSGYGGSPNGGRVVYTPSLSGAEAPGVYKLMLRARRSVSEDVTITPKIAGQFTLDPLTWPAGGTNTRVLDVGLLQLPAGQPQQLAAPIAPLGAASPQVQVDVTKGATGVAVNVDLDWFYLVPADEDLGVAYQSASVPAGTYLTLDGYAQEAYLSTGDPFVATSNGYSGTTAVDWIGGVPRLYPGSNRLFLMAGLNASGSAPANTITPTFSVSYWPRYTWLI